MLKLKGIYAFIEMQHHDVLNNKMTLFKIHALVCEWVFVRLDAFKSGNSSSVRNNQSPDRHSDLIPLGQNGTCRAAERCKTLNPTK